MESDAEYAQVVGDSRRKWREAHPGYSRRYRERHPAVAERNRRQQRRRDQKRRIQNLAKNNLASCQFFIFQPLAPVPLPANGS
jgi:hypothetical protein